ncbi:DUF3592 domain-containing protein [Streptomyces roseoverticillatus]|uniref:DUF3592 domain-containing protein n=1 Tax=Streptomyces roseoverticillatus TaxID=66429 RepID=UPI001FE02C05|nr:DUF3592 domain-containing protein [Streptomyces roseoverticillatus]
MEIRIQTRGQGAHRWLAFGMITVGALCLVAGLIFAGMSVSFLTDAQRARGTVVALDWREDHGGGSRTAHADDAPAAYPVVEFTSADGTLRKFRDSAGSNPPSYEVGEQVEVLYRPGSPEDARIKGFLSLWLMPLIFGGIGLVFTGIGTGFALAARRRR